MMYEAYKSLSDSGIRLNDKVVIKYKYSSYFMKTGKVVSIITSGENKGDCTILMDYDKVKAIFSYSLLLKVEEFIEIPSGEVFNISYDNAVELAISGIGKWNDKMSFYYFKEDDRWQIESYMI